jgi:hypothetical protein
VKYYKSLLGFGFFIATVFIIWSIFAFLNMFWNFGTNWVGSIWLGFGLVIMVILIREIMKRHSISNKRSNLVLDELRYNPNATPEQIATATGIALLDVRNIVPTSNNDISQFRDLLFEMRKDRRNIVQDTSELRRKMAEGGVIVLKGDPRYMALFLIAIVTTAIIITTIIYFLSHKFDLQTFIILLASTLTIGFAAVFSARNKLLILHPEGFLYRKNIFFVFCQKWSNLTSQPQFSIDSGPHGEKWYNLKFTGMWGTKRFNVFSLKLKDIKGIKRKLQFLWEIISKFFEANRMN